MLSDPLADVVPDEVVADLARLREEWGEFAVIAEREDAAGSDHVPASLPEVPVYRYAGAWIRRDGEVLLVRPGDDDGWTCPGGTREPGETFAATARREVREETGVRCRPTGVLDATVTLVEADGRDSVTFVGAVFHADHVGGQARPEPGEIDAVRWASEIPPEEDLVFPRIADYPL